MPPFFGSVTTMASISADGPGIPRKRSGACRRGAQKVRAPRASSTGGPRCAGGPAESEEGTEAFAAGRHCPTAQNAAGDLVGGAEDAGGLFPSSPDARELDSWTLQREFHTGPPLGIATGDPDGGRAWKRHQFFGRRYRVIRGRCLLGWRAFRHGEATDVGAGMGPSTVLSVGHCSVAEGEAGIAGSGETDTGFNFVSGNGRVDSCSKLSQMFQTRQIINLKNERGPG